MVKVREIINVEGLPVDGFDDGAAMDPSKLYYFTCSSDSESLKCLKVLYLRSGVMFQVTSIRRTTLRAAYQPHRSFHDMDGFRDHHLRNYPNYLPTADRLLSQLVTMNQLIQKSRRSAELVPPPQNVRVEYTNARLKYRTSIDSFTS